ncbi:Na+/H+ antiporter NhaA [Arcticibacter pallidicorallinus]|uniref:Na+/H+ antiporter NhaA n=1 Tax=Arcticibacter pallidicorallinus TaxID=1259464 RepID=UPI000D0746C5
MMAICFLLVGLGMKREITEGMLSSLEKTNPVLVQEAMLSMLVRSIISGYQNTLFKLPPLDDLKN